MIRTSETVNGADKTASEAIGAVMVCGAGITGIQASLDLAESGFKVYLVESSAAIGGRMAQLDKTFPTGDCAMCTLSPKLVECARNRNIEIITLADVEDISGQPGNFQVRIRQRPRYVDLEKCNACGDCVEVCPVALPSEFDCAQGERKAIFRPYPQAIPNVYGISKSDGRAPCKASCPAGINAQGYVALIAEGKFKEAYDLIREQCPLPAVCGRVCHHPCQDDCNRNEVDQPVAVRDLKRFAADYVHAHADEFEDTPAEPIAARDGKVAVIGGGPAGLTTAHDLVKMGYGVTVFEAEPRMGGMLRYGIPSYRLADDVLDREIKYIEDLGVEMRTNCRIEDPKTLLQPSESDDGGFNAVFVAIGAWASKKLGIPGEDAPQTLMGLKFLYEVNSGRQPEIGPNVVVIGGGDVAMDAARCALRMPGVRTVHLACLESCEEMPAHQWEADEAVEEGVVFHNCLGPTEIRTEGDRVTGVAFRACTRVFDQAGQFSPEFDDSRTTDLAADTVIVTIGQGIDDSNLGGLTGGPGGRIAADTRTLATDAPGVFAGGDAVLGPASLVDAIAQGHTAAKAIDAYIRGVAPRGEVSRQGDADVEEADTAPNPDADAPPVEQRRMPRAPAGERTCDFREIDLGYSLEDAVAEARRCLACGLCSECGQCVVACEPGAIDHDMQPSERTLDVGSVILTPGFDAFQAARRGEFGHGRYANVLSSIQFERMLSAAGPTAGEVFRPSDGGHVESIAFIQCVGSRDAARGSGYCSAICCMSAAKEAMCAIEHIPEADVSIFCMDIRAFGKEFDRYVDRARDEHNVEFIRAIPSRIVEMPDSKKLRIRFFDADGAEQFRQFDMVVLSVGLRPSASVCEMAGRLGLELNEFGFCQTDRLSPMASSRPGVYVAGACQEPKDIPESVAQGSGAAARAMSQLADVRGSLIAEFEYPWERDVTDEEPRIGVFICHCGHNIASVVDVEEVARRAGEMPNVVHAEASLYTCSDTNQQRIKDLIGEHRLNRLVVASCTPRTHEPLFQETLRVSGLNKYLFTMTNIRDQCSWVHREDRAAATEKAIALMGMSVARARHLRALETGQAPVVPAALVIGGGLAGMTTALAIGDQGFNVHLVETESQLGGNLRELRSTLEGADVQACLADLVARVEAHPGIDVYLNSTVERTDGHIGKFISRIVCGGAEQTIEHGVTIVAIGGVERETEMYLHGTNDRVITQRKLEQQLSGDGLDAELGERPTIVMIQCVESRNDDNPYCSRVCCSEAVKNALEIKRQRPDARVIVLAKDIRTYGFREIYFEQARTAGVLFIRHPRTEDPRVSEDAGRLTVRLTDGGTRRQIELYPDLLVLSTGIAPAKDNPVLSGMLRTALTEDGFFLEAHPKLRPVDLANEGEFICGLSHSPRFMDETIAQACAVAGRAATILSQSHLTIPGQIAHVDPTDCVACATCVKVCPYGAPEINERGKAEIQGAVCMGCGNCTASCPARAITLKHQEDQQIGAMIRQLLVEGGAV